jgi:hypothetical protein
MKTYKEWIYNEFFQNADWDHIKAMKFKTDPEIKSFILPKINKIQDQIIAKLKENNKNVNSFRDVSPEMRDQFAQAIISSTLDAFFDGIGVSSNLLSPNQNASVEKEKSPEILPQDELKSPIGSKG